MPSNVIAFPGAALGNLALGLAELEQRVNTLYGITAAQTGQIATVDQRVDTARTALNALENRLREQRRDLDLALGLIERLRANAPAPAPQQVHDAPPCSFCLERCSFCPGPDNPLRP